MTSARFLSGLRMVSGHEKSPDCGGSAPTLIGDFAIAMPMTGVALVVSIGGPFWRCAVRRRSPPPAPHEINYPTIDQGRTRGSISANVIDFDLERLGTFTQSRGARRDARVFVVVSIIYAFTPMKDEVAFVTITTDPARDTAEVLREYGDLHGLDPVNWMILTSGPDEPEDTTRRLAEEFGLKFTQTDDGLCRPPRSR